MAVLRSQNKRLKDLGEFSFIETISKKIKNSFQVRKGIGDDAAVLKYTAQKDLLFTSDMLVEGTHFDERADPIEIGYKAICCSISDIAAMGGFPKFALVSLGVPEELSVKFAEDLYSGMQKAAKKYNADIVGGDTVRSEKITIAIAMIGDVKRNDSVTRSGAKPGDRIYVTGRLGNSLSDFSI